MRSEEHTSELQSLMRNSYAVFCCSSPSRIHPSPTRRSSELLFAGVATLLWDGAFLRRHDGTPLAAADKDPLTLAALKPSQRALGKYLFVVVALFVFQVFIGGFTAHYTIEGQSFYGVD